MCLGVTETSAHAQTIRLRAGVDDPGINREAAVEARSPVPFSRRDFLRTAGAGGVVLATGGVLAGCTSSSSSPSASTTATIKKGGTFRVGLIGGSGSSETLDPNGLTPSDLALYRIQNVFSKLTDMDHTGNYVPQLAESLEPNSDASQWVVRLRPGVLWHDGSDVTADDVIYSFQRVLNPKNSATLGAAA